MSDKTITINLFKYYSDMSVHHRLMMLAFLSVYFAITQFVLATPNNTGTLGIGKNVLASVLGLGLALSFVLSSAMHHACHLCAATGVKAILAADLHYQNLPKTRDDADAFVGWINTTALEVRESLAIRSFSIYILALFFILLGLANSVALYGAVRDVLANSHRDAKLMLMAILALLIVAIAFYLFTFWKHYRYFQIAKKELQLVLKCDTQQQVIEKIEALHGLPPEATTWAEFLLLKKNEKRRRR